MTLRTLPILAVALLATGCILDPNDLEGGGDGGPPPNCEAVPICDDGWVEVDECPQDDVDCRERSLCGTTIHCMPAAQCLAFPSCRPDEEQSEEPCGEGEADCRQENLCGATIYCRDGGDQCAAYPSCHGEEVPTEEPCEENEELCREVSLCGATIYCREDIGHCEAYLVCDEGDEESEIACDPDADEPCYTRSICGYTINCRPGPMCDAEPTCEPWEIASNEACFDDEWGCRAEEECGGIIYCREDPCADGAAEPAPPPDDDDDGEEDSEEAPRDPIVACP